MTTQIFVNLPVKDLDRSVAFFKRLGFNFNPQFTDENATCMVVADNIFVMLLVEKYFSTFTPRAISDAHTRSEVIVSLSAESRAEVDARVDEALQAGGSPSSPTQDMGWMYTRGFADPDGHLWELAYMDLSAMEQG